MGLIVAVALAAAGPFVVTFTDHDKPEQKTNPLDLASSSATRFTSKFVDADGRAVRHDQGDDTTSTGQSYALLITAATGDRQAFDKSWTWAQSNLQQKTGLFASDWKNGTATDSNSSAIADLNITRALVVAARRFSDTKYSDMAKSIASAIEQNDVKRVGDKTVITSDTAIDTQAFDPRAISELQTLTSNEIWNSAATTAQLSIDTLIGSDSKKVPANWAQIDGSGSITPAPDNATTNPVYSSNAQHELIHLAESCNSSSRESAQRIWSVISRSRDARTATVLDLNGSIKDNTKSAVAALPLLREPTLRAMTFSSTRCST